jgi:hypothetical protein
MAVSVLIGAIAVALFASALRYRSKRTDADQALDLALIQAHREARTILPEEDLKRLEAQLEEIAAVGREAHQRGMSAAEATRMGKQAAIQRIISTIEFEKRFPSGEVA